MSDPLQNEITCHKSDMGIPISQNPARDVIADTLPPKENHELAEELLARFPGVDRAGLLKDMMALCFYWMQIDRQVRVWGHVEPVSGEEADAYFASRPRLAQIGAWASQQSRPMKGRFDLEKKVAAFTAKFGVKKVPRPPYWVGYRVIPEQIEFWKQKPFRLHERILYVRDGGRWKTSRLYP